MCNALVLPLSNTWTIRSLIRVGRWWVESFTKHFKAVLFKTFHLCKKYFHCNSLVLCTVHIGTVYCRFFFLGSFALLYILQNLPLQALKKMIVHTSLLISCSTVPLPLLSLLSSSSYNISLPSLPYHPFPSSSSLYSPLHVCSIPPFPSFNIIFLLNISLPPFPPFIILLSTYPSCHDLLLHHLFSILVSHKWEVAM